jgi:hypothetical protein
MVKDFPSIPPLDPFVDKILDFGSNLGKAND